MKSAERFLANLHRGISTPAVLTHCNILPPEIEFAALTAPDVRAGPGPGPRRIRSPQEPGIPHRRMHHGASTFSDLGSALAVQENESTRG
ncbi:MAG TPA: hypothetical protein VKB38_09510 [Terracidiphilus sp.]|nr:hypothetical protein [Terracidiphilus sp.]